MRVTSTSQQSIQYNEIYYIVESFTDDATQSKQKKQGRQNLLTARNAHHSRGTQEKHLSIKHQDNLTPFLLQIETYIGTLLPHEEIFLYFKVNLLVF